MGKRRTPLENVVFEGTLRQAMSSLFSIERNTESRPRVYSYRYPEGGYTAASMMS